MDGGFAVAFLVASLFEMTTNHCGTAAGCVGAADTPARLAFSAGQVWYQEDQIGQEVYLRYDLGTRYGPFQPIMGVSVTDSRDVWAGAGAAWTGEAGQFYAQLHLMVGLYGQGAGPDLGHVVEFRSGAEVGYAFDNDWRLGLSFDHRSNGDVVATNPGLETVQLRILRPF